MIDGLTPRAEDTQVKSEPHLWMGKGKAAPTSTSSKKELLQDPSLQPQPNVWGHLSDPGGWGMGFGSERPGFKSQFCCPLAVSLDMLLSLSGPELSSGKELTLLIGLF